MEPEAQLMRRATIDRGQRPISNLGKVKKHNSRPVLGIAAAAAREASGNAFVNFLPEPLFHNLAGRESIHQTSLPVNLHLQHAAPMRAAQTLSLPILEVQQLMLLYMESSYWLF